MARWNSPSCLLLLLALILLLAGFVWVIGGGALQTPSATTDMPSARKDDRS
jgi:uncharacterized ion transporter superfamily protein YfcC